MNDNLYEYLKTALTQGYSHDAGFLASYLAMTLSPDKVKEVASQLQTPDLREAMLKILASREVTK